MNNLTMFNKEWAQMFQLTVLNLLRKKDLTGVRKFIKEDIKKYKEVFDENFGQFSHFCEGVVYLNMLQNIDLDDEKISSERDKTSVEMVSMFYQIDDQNDFTIILLDLYQHEIGSWTIYIGETGEAKLSCEHDL